MPKGRFIYDQRPAKSKELERLIRLNELYRPLMQELFQNHYSQYHKTTFEIIDIGAGTGHCTIDLKKIFPNAEVTYFDLSPTLMNYAKGIAKKEKSELTFILGDFAKFEFTKKYDFVFSRFALKHIYNPEAAIQKMVDLLKPNGTILLMDKDVSANIWYPVFPLYKTKYMQALNEYNDKPERGGNSFVGRSIKYMLAKYGISDISTTLNAIDLTSEQNTEHKKLYTEVYFNLLPELVAEGLISQNEAEHDLKRLTDFFNAGGNLSVIFDFITKGSKI